MSKTRTTGMKFNLRLHLPQVLRIVVIAVIVIALVGGVALALRGCVGRKGAAVGGGQAIEAANVQAEYYSMKDAFVAFDGSFARVYGAKKGELLWEVSPDGSQGFRCAVSEDLLALYKDNTLVVYDNEGMVSFSSTPEQRIDEVRTGVSRVAIRYADGSIQIIDSTGKRIETIESAGGAVLDFGLYSASDLMWVLKLDAEGIEPKCTLNIYQPGKLLIAGYTTTEQLYYRPILFGNNVYLVGTSTIDVRNTNDLSESSVLIHGWTLRDHYAGEKLTILLSLTEQGESATALRILKDGASRDVRMNAGCSDLVLGEKYVYGFAGSTIYAVPTDGGRTQSYALPYSVEEVLCRVDADKVLLSGEGRVWLTELP